MTRTQMDLETTQMAQWQMHVKPHQGSQFTMCSVAQIMTAMDGQIQAMTVSMMMECLGGERKGVMITTKMAGQMMAYLVIDIQQIGSKL